MKQHRNIFTYFYEQKQATSIFCPDDEGSMSIQNIVTHVPDHTVSWSGRPQSKQTPQWKSPISERILTKHHKIFTIIFVWIWVFHYTKICEYVNRDSVCRIFVQSKSCNLLRLVGHVEKLNAGQGLLLLTDIIKVCVEQTSCCRIVLSLSEAFMRQRLRQNSFSPTNGARGGVVVKALRYKPAGRGFDSRWCYWNFSVT